MDDTLMAPKKKRVKVALTRATFTIPEEVRKDMVTYLSHLNWSKVVTDHFRQLVEKEKKARSK